MSGLVLRDVAAPQPDLASAALGRLFPFVGAPAKPSYGGGQPAASRPPVSVEAVLTRSLLQHRRVFAEIATLRGPICEAAVLMADSLHRGGRLLFFGNGASAASGSHLAAIFNDRLRAARRPPTALALGAHGPAMTAIANGGRPQGSVSRLLAAYAHTNDCAVAMASSAPTAELRQALETARTMGVASVALLGADGSEAEAQADLSVIVPHREEALVQEAHIFIGHTWCEQIEAALRT